MFCSIHYKNGWSAAFDLFYMFTQSMKFYYTFYHHALIVLIFENCDSLNRRKNEWLLVPASFTAKLGLVFVLALENAFP